MCGDVDELFVRITDISKEAFCSAVVIRARGLVLIYSHSYVITSVILHSHCLRYVLHETGLCKVMTTKTNVKVCVLVLAVQRFLDP